MKRLLIISFIFMVLFCLPVMADTYYKCEKSSVNINYLNNGSKEYDILYCNGRLYVPFEKACKDFQISIKSANNGHILFKDNKEIFVSSQTGKSNKTDMYYYNNKSYIYIYKLIEPFNQMPVIDLTNNTINIYNSVDKAVKYYKSTSKSNNEAYIRLEDIMADGLDKSLTPNYDIAMLEKLIYTAKYLYESGQSYYIAWIPVYANPRANYWNDISQSYNLYNSYFVYTLDYMIEHNGHLGLHGYTHQYGNDISAVGYEWGENTPYSKEEQENRIKKAINCADRLGFNVEFFEFPHYGATMEQIKMAEKYFNIIYQSYPTEKFKNHFTYSSASGKKVYFMPTPADYVHTKYDLIGILNRLSTCINNNYTVSLFYHPVIDTGSIHGNTIDKDRVWKYDNDGVLPNIVKYISANKYIFSPIA
ncbi:MAG: DUF2334 domain-containing protein [Lachnospirales bacterium]